SRWQAAFYVFPAPSPVVHRWTCSRGCAVYPIAATGALRSAPPGAQPDLLFGLPGRIEFSYLKPDVPNVDRKCFAIVIVTAEVIDDKAKGDQQIDVGIPICNNFIVISRKPANRFFVPPRDLYIIFVNRILSALVAIEHIGVCAHLTPVLR